MNERTQKAVNTRIERLTRLFNIQHGRSPSMEEIQALYSAEMRHIGSKSSRNAKGTGGFAKLTPEQRREVSQKALKARWHKDEH